MGKSEAASRLTKDICLHVSLSIPRLGWLLLQFFCHLSLAIVVLM